MQANIIPAKQSFIAPDLFPFLEVRTTLNSVLPYAEHFHSAFSWGLMLEGRTRFSLMGALHEARKGDIVLIGPGMPHSCNPVNGQPRGYHMAYFELRWFAANVVTALALPENWTVVTPVVRNAALYDEALDILHDFCASRAVAKRRFVDFFARMQTAHACLSAVRGQRAEATAEISRIMNEAATVCAQDPAPTRDLTFPAARPVALPEGAPLCFTSVSGLARKAGLRRESFTRAFHRAAGLPPKTWLHCLRLEKARILLRQGKSITEAALAVGYVDQSHFHRMFVKYFSVTPGCYQRRESHLYKTRK